MSQGSSDGITTFNLRTAATEGGNFQFQTTTAMETTTIAEFKTSGIEFSQPVLGNLNISQHNSTDSGLQLGGTKLAGVTDGTAEANKALIVDQNKDITNLRNVSATDGSFGAITLTSGSLTNATDITATGTISTTGNLKLGKTTADTNATGISTQINMRDWYISTNGEHLSFIYDNSSSVVDIDPSNSKFQIRTDGNVYIKNLETKSTTSLVTTDMDGKLNNISLKPGLKLTPVENVDGTEILVSTLDPSTGSEILTSTDPKTYHNTTILYSSESENIELTRDNEIITNNYTEHYLWNFYEEELFKNPVIIHFLIQIYYILQIKIVIFLQILNMKVIS
jgi:hypothetical protein